MDDHDDVRLHETVAPGTLLSNAPVDVMNSRRMTKCTKAVNLTRLVMTANPCLPCRHRPITKQHRSSNRLDHIVALNEREILIL